MRKDFNVFYALSLVTQIGIYIAFIIVIFIIGGNWLDKKLSVDYFFTILGLFISILAIPYGIYKLIKPLFKK